LSQTPTVLPPTRGPPAVPEGLWRAGNFLALPSLCYSDGPWADRILSFLLPPPAVV